MAETSLQAKERFVSRKLWIAELLAGEFKQTEGEEPNVLITPRTSASRVNILGVIISKEELPVPTIIVDDGTGQATIRSFERPLKQGIGAIVQVIGRPRTYQGELYVALELVSQVDPGWAEYRKAELGEIKILVKEPHQEQELIEENNAEKILRLIKQLDTEEGADIDQVILMSKLPNAEDIINQMLMHGDIFELRPGKVKQL